MPSWAVQSGVRIVIEYGRESASNAVGLRCSLLIPSEAQTMCRGRAVKVEDARPNEGNARATEAKTVPVRKR